MFKAVDSGLKRGERVFGADMYGFLRYAGPGVHVLGDKMHCNAGDFNAIFKRVSDAVNAFECR